MALYNTTYTGTQTADRFDAIRTDLRQRFEAWKVYRRTVNELNALSDRDLSDLGLHRSAIRGIAIEAAYGK